MRHHETAHFLKQRSVELLLSVICEIRVVEAGFMHFCGANVNNPVHKYKWNEERISELHRV